MIPYLSSAILFALGLCWGSFLNTIAWRFILDRPFFTQRSYCPACNKIIAWYDLIPVISWLLLHTKCRWCRAAISPLYPLGELITGAVFLLLTSFGYPFSTWFLLVAFASSLIITITTDSVSMVISRLVTLGLIPCAFVASWLHITTIPLWESLIAAASGYAVLWGTNYLYAAIRKQQGLGEGDMELLAMIGSFLGLLGVWFSLMFGSLLCSAYAIVYLLLSRKKWTGQIKIPFGPWLALAALTALFIDKTYLLSLFSL